MTTKTTQELREAIKRNTVAIKIVSKDASGSGSVKEHDHYEYLLHENFEKDLLSLIAKHEAEAKAEAYKEVIAFRSPYVYDDYSSLYQQSAKVWLEYAEKEGKFLEAKLTALTEKESK